MHVRCGSRLQRALEGRERGGRERRRVDAPRAAVRGNAQRRLEARAAAQQLRQQRPGRLLARAGMQWPPTAIRSIAGPDSSAGTGKVDAKRKQGALAMGALCHCVGSAHATASGHVDDGKLLKRGC
jgi:hypothetical protein